MTPEGMRKRQHKWKSMFPFDSTLMTPIKDEREGGEMEWKRLNMFSLVNFVLRDWFGQDLSFKQLDNSHRF